MIDTYIHISQQQVESELRASKKLHPHQVCFWLLLNLPPSLPPFLPPPFPHVVSPKHNSPSLPPSLPPFPGILLVQPRPPASKHLQDNPPAHPPSLPPYLPRCSTCTTPTPGGRAPSKWPTSSSTRSLASLSMSRHGKEGGREGGREAGGLAICWPISVSSISTTQLTYRFPPSLPPSLPAV